MIRSKPSLGQGQRFRNDKKIGPEARGSVQVKCFKAGYRVMSLGHNVWGLSLQV